MTRDGLTMRVDEVIAYSYDDERAHAMEDQLMRDVIAAWCPKWVQAELERLSNADFGRYCA